MDPAELSRVRESRTVTIGYILGGLAFIPGIGAVFGIGAIAAGVSTRRKAPAIMGAFGILLSAFI